MDSAGFGFLPPSVARRAAAAEIVEQGRAREEKRQREEAAEARRERNQVLARELAAARGEILSPVEEYRGRSIGDIFAVALQQAAAADAADAIRLQREGTGPPAPVHVMFDEPVIHSAQRSQHGMAIFNRSRHFFDKLAAQRRLRHAEQAAELAGERARNDHGLVDGVAWPSPADRDPVVWISAGRP